jgi:hypothetical protein
MVNAIKALAEIGDPNGVPALIEATRHENAFVRHDAACALGEMRDPRAVPALESLLGDATIPVEKDARGLTTQTSIYSVADQARRSLDKLSANKFTANLRSPSGLAVSLVLTAVGVVVLAFTAYGFVKDGVLSKLGLVSGLGIVTLGVIGLATSLTGSRES